MKSALPYTNTSNVRANTIQHRNHMLPLSNATLEARVESIPREESKEFRLPLKGPVITIVGAQCLEASNTADWFAATGSEIC